MTTDEKYMARCLQLAQNGRYGAPPNPMVGAVIVHQGTIIGEGYHEHCGGPHAEVNAVHSVRDTSLLKDSTLYVSLEPCSHYGKTPPCADLIVRMGIPRVVAGCCDPFALVAGQGIKKLRDAGVDVTVGVLEKECLWLNRRFITFHTHRRPYVTLKWAESADGFMDRERTDVLKESPYRFSTPYTQMLVHRQRALHQAILVGRNTAWADNPALTDRKWLGRSPLRLVIDRKGTLPSWLNVFNGEVPTRVYTERTSPEEKLANVTFKTLDFESDIIPQVMDDLYQLSVQSLLVEGGRQMLESFIAAGCWDEVRVEQTPTLLGSGVPSPSWPRGRKECIETDGRHLIYIHAQTGDLAAQNNN